MKHSLKSLYIAGALMLGGTTAMAQAERINIVTTATPFLRISPDARAGGMGDQGISTSPDVNAQFYNLAKYAFAESNSGIGLTYTPWLKDIGVGDVYLASLAGYYKFSETQALSGSLRYFNLGSIQFTDASGNELNMSRPREFSLDLGYSQKLSERLSLGVALRYIHSNLASNAPTTGVAYKAGTAVSGDVGLYYTTADEEGQGWKVGAAFTNLGSKIGYTNNASERNFIPANFGIGVGHTWVSNELHKVSLHGEVNKLLVPTPPKTPAGFSPDDSVANAQLQDEFNKYNSDGVVNGWIKAFGNDAFGYSLGGEYTYNDQFALRAGYYGESASMGKRSYFTLGVGINYSMFGLNFSYLLPSGSGVNRNPLSNTIRFGLIFNLGNIGEGANVSY